MSGWTHLSRGEYTYMYDIWMIAKSKTLGLGLG
jgi:hypothetical protein